MLPYTKFALVFSFLSLWVASLFSVGVQEFTGFFLIITFGIMHGANDIYLARNLVLKNNLNSFFTIISTYVVVVIFVGLLYFVSSTLVLFLFIVFSAYHFGEQQLYFLKKTKNILLVRTAFFCHGIFILFLLFILHFQEVYAIIYEITSISISIIYIKYVFFTFGIILALCFTLLVILEATLFNNIAFEIFYLLIFSILFKTGTLVWSFAIYFVVWHSIPSILDQIKFLYGSVTRNRILDYFKTGFMYWLVSILSLAVFYYFFKNEKLFHSIFFCFLSSITFPHFFVILKMVKNKLKDPNEPL